MSDDVHSPTHAGPVPLRAPVAPGEPSAPGPAAASRGAAAGDTDNPEVIVGAAFAGEDTARSERADTGNQPFYERDLGHRQRSGTQRDDGILLDQFGGPPPCPAGHRRDRTG